ncbi:MAG: glycine--tRNA ligase subunit alpha [Chloroflexi bacterium]|nr:glycine--tRNA ligase subunit alpha [Chloroflexota bacterium]
MTGKPLNFQQVILKLHEFWAAHDCVIWEPYNVQVGAGTGNPATLLRVLGPEPWRVAYVEPSVRPDDGRYGENPNRMQKYYQYQVILKPDPGNPQELYLQSLEALGIDPREHDIRFVEDNWESPALGAWGLGWEVWLDGQEITQFTYFQQAGGLELNPPAVEITYGVERIVLALQGRDSAWDIEWLGDLQYRDMMLQDEIDHCRYYFDLADVENLREVYDIYEGEHKRSLEAAAIIPAYDYILKCSHLFNVLDARGAVGVTERASYFRRMRDMTRNIAKAYVAQRESLGFPILKMAERWAGPALQTPTAGLAAPTAPADVLIELGIEELPAQDVDDAQAQLEQSASRLFEELRLANDGVRVMATPRRLVIHARGVQPVQPNQTTIEKGPPAERAFNADGTPTKAAEGFARSRGIDVSALTVEDVDGGKYVMARVERKGRPAIDVLAEALPAFVGAIKFPKSMRWNETNQAFSRPLRWILALFGQQVIRLRSLGSPAAV